MEISKDLINIYKTGIARAISKRTTHDADRVERIIEHAGSIDLAIMAIDRASETGLSVAEVITNFKISAFCKVDE